MEGSKYENFEQLGIKIFFLKIREQNKFSLKIGINRAINSNFYGEIKLQKEFGLLYWSKHDQSYMKLRTVCSIIHIL